MRLIKSAVVILTLPVFSFAASFRTISATGLALDDAGSQMAQQVKQAGAKYKNIKSASGNKVHITASLYNQ